MNKSDLVNSVAQAASITKAQATEAVNAVFSSIELTLKNKEKAAFIGFGTFSINERKERTGIKPGTSEKVLIPAKSVVKFKAGKGLEEAVN